MAHLHFPYLSGWSFQWAPLRSVYNTPLTKLRLSSAVAPSDPGRPGMKCSIL